MMEVDKGSQQREAVVIDALRTPVGRRNGRLKNVHPADLLARVLAALVKRVKLDAGMVDDVIAGCVSQVGEQSTNIARNALLGAGFPESVPGTTVDRQCGSSQQALHFAAQGIISGAYDIVIAAGVESMTRVPMGSAALQANPFGELMAQRYQDRLVPQGVSAELIAQRWKLSRQELDAFALESHRRAARATQEGRFDSQLLSLTVDESAGEQGIFAHDEGIRYDTNLEKLASLQPAFRSNGVVTAGNASQISDGAAAVLLMERATAERYGFRPRARFHTTVLAADDPVLMLTAPIPATKKVLAKAALSLDDIDVVEINEAFASVVLAWQREMKLTDLKRVNVNGGAIALGHPLGASGARLFTTLLNELERVKGRYGLQTMCEGGGMANALIIERLAE